MSRPDCPYPPSDPVCQAGPTTSTTILRVSVVNQDSAIDVSPSVQAVQREVEHQTDVIAVGFIAVSVILVLVGAAIIAAINSTRNARSS